MQDLDLARGDQATIVLRFVGRRRAAALNLQVHVDGHPAGMVHDGVPRYLHVTPGVHHVAVKAGPFWTRERAVAVAAGGRVEMECGACFWIYSISIVYLIPLLYMMLPSTGLAFSFVQLIVLLLWVWTLHSVPGFVFFLRPSRASLDPSIEPLPVDPPDAKALAAPARRRGNGVSLRSLLILVAGCALITLFGKQLWEGRSSNRPAMMLKKLYSKDKDDRKDAVSFMFYLISTKAFTPEEEDKAISGILFALKDENPEVREAAANTVFSIGIHASTTQTPMPRLQDVALGLAEALVDTVPKVRHLSALNLIDIYSSSRASGKTLPALPADIDKFLELLGRGLDDPDSGNRSRVARTLGEIAPRVNRGVPRSVLAALHAEDSGKRKDAIETVTAFRPSLEALLPELLQIMEHDPDSEVREACSQRLIQIKFSPDVLPVFEKGLSSPERLVRFRSAHKLSEIGAPARKCIPALLPLLHESFEPVTSVEKQFPQYTDPAVAACWALGSLAPGTAQADQVKRALEELRARDDRPWRRRNVSDALQRIDGVIEPEVTTRKEPTPSK